MTNPSRCVYNSSWHIFLKLVQNENCNILTLKEIIKQPYTSYTTGTINLTVPALDDFILCSSTAAALVAQTTFQKCFFVNSTAVIKSFIFEPRFQSRACDVSVMRVQSRMKTALYPFTLKAFWNGPSHVVAQLVQSGKKSVQIAAFCLSKSQIQSKICFFVWQPNQTLLKHIRYIDISQ